MAKDKGYQKPQPAKDAPVVQRTDFGTFTYPAKLTENYKAWVGEGTKRRLVWYQEFERLDQQWPDGNPVRRINQSVLSWGDGSPAKAGDDADVLAGEFFDVAGCDLLPDTPGSEDYVGHVFRLKDVKKEGTDKIYIRMPVDYMGEDFIFTGKVQTIGDSVGGGSNGPQPSTAEHDMNNAAVLSTLLDGENAIDVKAGTPLFKSIIDSPDMADVKTILGVSLRGGLLKGTILSKLEDEGLIEIDSEGIISAI